MANSFTVENKLLLIERLKKDVSITGKISQKNLDFIDFFYKWQELDYHTSLKEFERMCEKR